jgi:hypothetical protein
VRVANRGSVIKSELGLECLLDLCRAVRGLLSNAVIRPDGLEHIS